MKYNYYIENETSVYSNTENKIKNAVYFDDYYVAQTDTPQYLDSSKICFFTIKDGLDTAWSGAKYPNGNAPAAASYRQHRPVIKCLYENNLNIFSGVPVEDFTDRQIVYTKYGTTDTWVTGTKTLYDFRNVYNNSAYYDLKHVNVFVDNEDFFEQNDLKDSVWLEWRANPKDLQTLINTCTANQTSTGRPEDYDDSFLDSVICYGSTLNAGWLTKRTPSLSSNRVREISRSVPLVFNQKYDENKSLEDYKKYSNSYLKVLDYKPVASGNKDLNCSIMNICSAVGSVKGLRFDVAELKEKYKKLRVLYNCSYNNFGHNSTYFNHQDDCIAYYETVDSAFSAANSRGLTAQYTSAAGLVGYWGFSNSFSSVNYKPSAYSRVLFLNTTLYDFYLPKFEMGEEDKNYIYSDFSINKIGSYFMESPLERYFDVQGMKVYPGHYDSTYPCHINFYCPYYNMNRYTYDDLQAAKYLKVVDVNFYEQYDEDTKQLIYTSDSFSTSSNKNTGKIEYISQYGATIPATNNLIFKETKYHNMWSSIKPNTYLSSYLDDTTSGKQLKEFLKTAVLYSQLSGVSTNSPYTQSDLMNFDSQFVLGESKTVDGYLVNKYETKYSLSNNRPHFAKEWLPDYIASLHVKNGRDPITVSWVKNYIFKTYYDIDLTTATDKYLFVTYPGINNLSETDYDQNNFKPIYTKFQMIVKGISGEEE